MACITHVTNDWNVRLNTVIYLNIEALGVMSAKPDVLSTSFEARLHAVHV
jgi:hypothetical protein